MIPIEKEPAKYFKEFKAYEKCFFCKEPTNTWHMPTNTPVCEGCAKVKEVGHIITELPKPDGRQNNGCAKGEDRGQGAKPRSKDGRKRPRWSHHFNPEHLERMQASGKGVAQTVEKALDMLFAWEDANAKCQFCGAKEWENCKRPIECLNKQPTKIHRIEK